MRKTKPMEINRTDLTTLLGILASQLRNDGFALLGIASERYRPGDQESSDLDELKASLDRTAGLLEVAGEQLCGECRLMEVSERTTFAAIPKEEPGNPGPSKRITRRGTRAKRQVA